MPRNSLEGPFDRTTRPEKSKGPQDDWIKIKRREAPQEEEELFVDAGKAFEEGMEEDEKFIDAKKVFKMGMREEGPFVDIRKTLKKALRDDADTGTPDAYDSEEEEGYVDIGKKREDAEAARRIEEQEKEARRMIKKIEQMRRDQNSQ